MKTFETEKHNIPEGATHYSVGGAGNYFTWYKRADGFKYRWVPSYIECWDAMDDRGDFNDNYVKPIPQTNIETPEEKEALDGINSNLIKPRELSKPVITKVEWGGAGLPPVGVECEVRFRTDGDWTDWFSKGKFKAGYDSKVWFSHEFGDCVYPSHDVEFRKPETQQQREERERLEAVEEMFTYWSDDKGDFVAGDDDDRWVKELLFSLHDAGYKRAEL